MIAKWVRPTDLTGPKAPEIPVYAAAPPGTGHSDGQASADELNRNVAGGLKLGHQEFAWIAAAISTIEAWSVSMESLNN